MNTLRKMWSLFGVAVRGSETEFTTGSIRKAIFLLAVPMILEMFMESLFALVDIFYVSKVSVNAMATVGLTEAVLMIVYSVAIGFSLGVTAMVARRVGERKPEQASRVATQTLYVGIALALIIGIPGVVFAPDMLRLMGGEEGLVQEGQDYTRIIFGGNVTVMLLFLLNAVFRGAGSAAAAMRVLWLANGLNIVLDPIFIFGLGPIPAMGVTGAAVATTIGRGVGVIFQLYILLKGVGILKVVRRSWPLDFGIIARLLNLSVGGIGQFLVSSASWLFLVRIISEFGSEAVAGYTIAFRVIVFTILPSWGLSNAAATLVGQGLGSGDPDRAEKSVWLTARYNAYFMATVSVLFFVLASPIIGLFTDDPLVKPDAMLGLRIICISYIFWGFGMVIGQAFNGAGDTRTPTFINFVSSWMFELPCAWFFGVTLGFGVPGVFSAVIVSGFVYGGLSILLFRRGKWKKVTV